MSLYFLSFITLPQGHLCPPAKERASLTQQRLMQKENVDIDDYSSAQISI